MESVSATPSVPLHLLPSAAKAPAPGVQRHQAGSLRAFFRYHGVWAPGVRLFRSMGFRAKAMTISLAFMIPLLVLAWSFQSGKQDNLNFVAAERAGVSYAKPLLNLVQASIRERQLARVLARGEPAPALPDARAATAKALAELTEQQALHGQMLDLGTEFQRLNQAMQEIKALNATDAEVVFKVYNVAIAEQAGLLDKVVDRSNLALDPEMASYYVMDAVVIAAPDLAQAVARLRARLVTAIKGGSAPKPADLAFMDREAQTVRQRLNQLDTSLGKAERDHANLRQELGIEGVHRSAMVLTEIAAKALDGQPLPTDTSEVTRQGTEAADGAFKVAQSGLAVLDGLLAERQLRLKESMWAVDLLTLVCVMAAAYLLYCFYRVTRGGMEEVRFHLVAMTDGDLTTSPKPWGKDEAAGLMLTLSDMQHSLRGLVMEVRQASQVIVQSSTEIASGSLDLSARTERTAANLEESAASMEQISATVRQTADHAIEAAELAAGNAGVASRGGQVIQDVVHTMHGIHQSSSKISDIIAVIDGIAFQTNILALNAAVEAARAGEQGRGFAVVAGEVRALAKRSATAANEIKALIQDSVGKVASGTTVVQSAGQTMGDIVANAERMNGLLSEIATASREQSAGVAQVGQAVQDLDRVTQENAALVEETAAASNSLKHQAIALAKAVGSFRLP
jgi:methyl-accepting chemotaxis protein